ncbi:hypothetical protein PS2_032107 [Malus domestica]
MIGFRAHFQQNATISGAAPPPPRVSTMGTITVATSVATRGEIHGAFITARAVPSKAHCTKAIIQVVPSKFARARAQASHSHASYTKQPVLAKQPALAAQPAFVVQHASVEQPTPVAQPAPAKQHALVTQPAPDEQPPPVVQPAPVEQPTLTAQLAPAEQPALVTQPAPDKQPTPVAQPAPIEQSTLTAQPAPVAFQAAQVGPRLSQPSGPTIKPGAFSPHFFMDLTFPNSNLAPGVYHPSTAQGGAFLPSSFNPNGEQHLSRQVIELTSALAQ